MKGFDDFKEHLQRGLAEAMMKQESSIWNKMGSKKMGLNPKKSWLHPFKWLFAREFNQVFNEGHVEKWLERNGYVKEQSLEYYKRVVAELLKHLGLEEDYEHEKHFLKKVKRGKK